MVYVHSHVTEVWILTRNYLHPAVLNELSIKQLLTSEECTEVARKGSWEDHLAQVLVTKPAEVMQGANQLLEEHGYHVEELKSRSHILHYDNLMIHS